MKIQIKATQKELSDPDKVGLAFSKVIEQVNPSIRDYLVKSIAPIKTEIAEPVILEVLKQWELSYKDQTEKMIDDIGAVFDAAAKKSLDDIDLEKGGPYIGPRGGKWADPGHTIPWSEEEHGYKDKGDRYSDEEADDRLSDLGDSLYEHQIVSGNVKDDTGFNHYDMQQWSKASTIKDKRRILKKYKRQITVRYSLDEYHKLGLSDKEKMLSDVRPYYHKNYGSLQLPVDGSINRDLFGKYLQIQKKYGARFDRESRVWYIAETGIDDFDFESYKSEMHDMGIRVNDVAGVRKKKETKEEIDANWSKLSIDEAFKAVQDGKVKDAVIVKQTSKNKFSFYFPFSRSLNELFRNSDPKKGEELIHGIRLSGIVEVKPGQRKGDLWGRETSDVDLIEEAIEKIKRVEPNFKIAIDPELKEAQAKRDRIKAELEKPIPEVQSAIAEGFKLRPYQNEAVRFFQKADGNALLGDEMGTGKTIMALAYTAIEKKKVIVVNPKTTRRGWTKEAVKFFPDYFKPLELDSSDLRKMGDEKYKELLQGKNLVSVNYESLHKFEPILKGMGFDTIIVDESHRMMNPKAKVTKTIQRIAKGLSHKILMSGTAIKNKKWELFTQLDLIAPGKYKTVDQLKRATIGGLWEDMKGIYLARSKSAVLKDLPPKITSISEHEVKGLPDYEIRSDGSKAIVGSDGEVIKEYVEIGDIAWLKNTIALGKADASIDLAKEIIDSSDSKMIIFSDSVEVAKKIANELGDVALLHHGSMSQDKREAIKDEFQNQDAYGEFTSTKRVLVSTRQSLSVGVTLTAADKVIFNDLPWTAADIRQAEDRTHRIGQNNAVNVYWVTADNNIFDSSVSEIVKRKYALGVKVNQGRKLTDEELKWMNEKVSLDDIVKTLSSERKPKGADVEVNAPTGPQKEDTIRNENKGNVKGVPTEGKYAITAWGGTEYFWPETSNSSWDGGGTDIDALDSAVKAEYQHLDSGFTFVKFDARPWSISEGVNPVSYQIRVPGKTYKGEIDSPTKSNMDKVFLEANDRAKQLLQDVNKQLPIKEGWTKNTIKFHSGLSYNKEVEGGRLDIDINSPDEILDGEDTRATVQYIGEGGFVLAEKETDISKFDEINGLFTIAESLIKKEEPKKVIREPSDGPNKTIKHTPVVLKETPKKKRGRPPKPENVKQAEKDLSIVSANNIKLKKIKTDEVHDYYRPNMDLDEDDARIAMNNLRSAGINAIVIPGKNSMVKIRKGFVLSELEDSLNKSFFIKN